MILKQVAGFCHQMKKTSLLIHLIYQLFDYNSNFSAPSAKSLFSINSQNFPITIPFSIHPNYFTLFYQFFVSHHTSRLVNIFPNGHQKCQYELHFPFFVMLFICPNSPLLLRVILPEGLSNSTYLHSAKS